MITYPIGEQIGALVLIIAFSAVGAFIPSIFHGFEIPPFGKFFPRIKIKPLITKFKIPNNICMIFMGFIARNFFGGPVKPYNIVWGQWIRICVLAIVLTRAGLQITFRGKGILVVILSIVPMIVEACIMALMTYGLFDMPAILCFIQGFASSAVAAAIIVPQMMVWNDKGYGKSKGMSSTLLASCTFDNIIV